MIKNLFTIALLFSSITVAFSNHQIKINQDLQEAQRLAELDNFWNKLSKTVKEGDYEGYKALYHEDAIIVFATGQNKTSVSISKALADWEQGFANTKAGKQKDNVEFRFSQRIGNQTTAHETGVFLFTSSNAAEGKAVKQFIHFEMLFVKRDNKWLAVMEYQKSIATQEEWDALK